MIMFLISEGMLFAGLLGGYFILRWAENGFPWQANHAWPPSKDIAHLPVFLTTINTVFLIASGSEGEIRPWLAFCDDRAWFHLRRRAVLRMVASSP